MKLMRVAHMWTVVPGPRANDADPLTAHRRPPDAAQAILRLRFDDLNKYDPSAWRAVPLLRLAPWRTAWHTGTHSHRKAHHGIALQRRERN